MLKEHKQLIIQVSLFLITIFTTTMAGLEWLGRSVWMEDFQWSEIIDGFAFSLPFLLILTVHEFGHYLTAQYYKVKVTLPYYIPMWFLGVGPSIGTMGAFIQIKDKIHSRKEYFDIGIAGPLAGFVVAFVLLVIGYRTLPETEYIYEFHPEYEVFGENFEEKMLGLDTTILKRDLNVRRMGFKALDDTIRTNRPGSIYFGDNLLMIIGRNYFAPDDRYAPSAREVMHYPLLLASFLAFFFTALNLLPIGQLDGGHILYGLVGAKWHGRIASGLFVLFVTYAGIGIINPHQIGDTFGLYLVGYMAVLYYLFYSMTPNKRDRLMYAAIVLTVQFFISFFWPDVKGYTGWLVFAFLIGRFLGVHHPPVRDDAPLSTGRKVLGWITLIVFILCFSPSPFGVD